MSRVTRFAARDPGPAARVAGFVAHLRAHGWRLGVAEVALSLDALSRVTASQPEIARAALRCVCAGSAEDAKRFDALFDSYWLDCGRVRSRVAHTEATSQHTRSSRDRMSEADTGGTGQPTAPDGDDSDASRDGTGKLVASQTRRFRATDLRQLISAEDITRAEAIARRIGAALRDRRSRRQKAARRGNRLHFRKTIRRSLATGGEPLTLYRTRRPDRPLRIVALTDVSGSMTVYARVFLAFLAGLMRADESTDAYLFHTRLVRISDALRERDSSRAIARMSLMADGFGGGSRIGPCLAQFATRDARRCVNGRSVVMIFSDGYDTAPPDEIDRALTRLRKRGCRILWLNPLKGWRDYAPVAAGMQAALPHLDLFCAANTLDDLAQLEREIIGL